MKCKIYNIFVTFIQVERGVFCWLPSATSLLDAPNPTHWS